MFLVIFRDKSTTHTSVFLQLSVLVNFTYQMASELVGELTCIAVTACILQIIEKR